MTATLLLPPTIPTPQPVLTEVKLPNPNFVALSQCKSRLAELSARSMYSYTAAECLEYIELKRLIAELQARENARLDALIEEEDRRRVSDVAEDVRTEARAFPVNPNPHDD